MHIGEMIIYVRVVSIPTALAALASEKTRSQTTGLFNRFLNSSKNKETRTGHQHNQDMYPVVCGRYACGERKRTIVPEIGREAARIFTFKNILIIQGYVARGLIMTSFERSTFQRNIKRLGER